MCVVVGPDLRGRILKVHPFIDYSEKLRCLQHRKVQCSVQLLDPAVSRMNVSVLGDMFGCETIPEGGTPSQVTPSHLPSLSTSASTMNNLNDGLKHMQIKTRFICKSYVS